MRISGAMMVIRLHAALAVGLLAAVFATTASAQDATRLVIWYEADGSAYLQNNSETDTYQIDGYTIASEHNDLIVADYDGAKGWRAIEDIEAQFPSEVEAMTAQLGLAALDFGSSSPAAYNLTEITLNHAGIEFSPGERWFLGKPFSTSPLNENGGPLPGYSFLFTYTNGEGSVGAIVGVPEPSTLLLAALAGLGLVGVGRTRAGGGRQLSD